MKYVKSPGAFSTNQFSISETLTEVDDVISIAKDIIQKIDNVPDDVKKELKLALTNLDQAITDYLPHIKRKMDIALKYVPLDVQEKECL